MDTLASFFVWLNAVHGINLSIFYDGFDRARFLGGLTVTVGLSVLCLVFSLTLGGLGAWLMQSRRTWVRGAIQAYVQLFRNTPPLVQLYFFYFAIGGVLPKVTDGFGTETPPLSNFTWAVVSFSLLAGAFNIEIFRAGIQAVPRATLEAAEALGFTRFQVFMHITLPLAVRIVLPALNNNLVNLVKTTTLAYAIGVSELLSAASQIWSESLNVREMMNVLLLVFLGLVGLLVMASGWLERRLALPGYRR